MLFTTCQQNCSFHACTHITAQVLHAALVKYSAILTAVCLFLPYSGLLALALVTHLLSTSIMR